ncbi:MAG: hypothetical protein JWN85_4082 [Gammaproteobacteria bacterium]|nr:hypothetical protein [Gammaproteobacteria bacterium]
MITMRSVRLLTLAVVLLSATLESFGEESRTFILATGCRDPRIYAIDLHKALQPENNNTSNAIVSRALCESPAPRWHAARRSGEHRPE